MSRIKESELIYRLTYQDPEAFILIVEGNTDIRFWSLVAPVSQRKNTTVYAIDSIEVLGVINSARQRATTLANRLWNTDIRDRVLFFLDADSDRLLGLPCPSNVVLTDFRDLESYAYHLESIREMLFSLNINPDEAVDTMSVFGKILRPCGLLRLADAKGEFCLPFQDSWGERLGRKIRGNRNNPQVEPRELITRLLQHAGIPISSLAQIEQIFTQTALDCTDVPTVDLMHGKDFIAVVSWKFQINIEVAAQVVLGALASSRTRIASFANLQRAINFSLLN